VQAPTLISIMVTPNPYTIASGTAVQFHTTGTYSGWTQGLRRESIRAG